MVPLKKKMWPFSKKVIPPSAPVAIAPDPHECALSELSAVEKELAKLDSEYKRIRYRYCSTTSTMKTIITCKGPIEGARVRAELQRIRHAGEIVAARRNAVLAALASAKENQP